MRVLLSLACLLLAPLPAFAELICTTAAPSTWQSQSQFRADVKAQGYHITKFKVTAGNCYEIYGYDAHDKPVEIYHNPVTGRPMKSEWVKRRT